MHAITLVIIYNYVLFGFRSNIILIILYDLQYSDLCVYLICDPIVNKKKSGLLPASLVHSKSVLCS